MKRIVNFDFWAVGTPRWTMNVTWMERAGDQNMVVLLIEQRGWGGRRDMVNLLNVYSDLAENVEEGEL